MDETEENVNQNNIELYEHYMEEALVLAGEALAQGEFPVGCVLVAGDTVLAGGRRLNSRGTLLNELDHAEIVTLRSLLREQPALDCSQVTCYSTMEPCLMCYSTMLLSGIRHFVWAYEDVMGGGTSLVLKNMPPLYAGMEVGVVPGVLRSESLQLFQKFFQKYAYWQGSMLEKYTLEQK